MAAIPLQIILEDTFLDVIVGATPTTGPFTFDYGFFTEASDIKVKRTDDATGVVTTLAYTTDYTVEGVAVSGGFQGGTVTLVSPDSDATLHIYRDIGISRTDWFPSAGPFDIQTLNETIAKSFAIKQELAETLGRTIKLGISEAGSLMADLPVLADRASKFLYFDASGDPTAVAATSGTAAVTAYMETVLDDTTAAEARTTLGLQIGVDVMAYDATMLVDADIGVTVQAYDADLDTWAGLTPSANAQSLVTAANYAAMRALLDLEAGTDFNAYDANRAVTDAVQNFTAGQRGAETTLVDGANIAIDLDDSNNFKVTLAGNRTLDNPTGTPVVGQSGMIMVTQDGTGSRTLAFGTEYIFAGGTDIVLSTAANAVDAIAYYVVSATEILLTATLDVK